MRIQDMSVLPFAPLQRAVTVWPEVGAAEVAAVTRAVLEGKWGIGSSELPALEREFAAMQRLPLSHAVVPTVNGTVALQLALEALDIGAGDHVIVPGLTWQATAGAVLDVNAVPELVDVTGDWVLNPAQVERHLRETQGTPEFPRAVIAVHLYNRVADVNRLVKICRRFGVWLIEDCAHAQGGSFRGWPLGSWGALSTFSTQSSKGLTSGEGGLIVTGVPILEQRLRSLISCGRDAEATINLAQEPDEHTLHWRQQADRLDLPGSVQSGNYRMNAVTAALLRAQIARFAGQHQARRETLAALQHTLAEIPGITLPKTPSIDPVAYTLAFEVDYTAFGDMDPEVFRQVLGYLLDQHEDRFLVLPTYDPLGGGDPGYLSPVYKPQTKRRHHIDDTYWEAINPNRFNLPSTHRAFRHGITIQHSALREPGFADTLAKALTTIHTHQTAINTTAA